jgi:hypothetical protein
VPSWGQYDAALSIGSVGSVTISYIFQCDVSWWQDEEPLSCQNVSKCHLLAGKLLKCSEKMSCAKASSSTLGSDSRNTGRSWVVQMPMQNRKGFRPNMVPLSLHVSSDVKPFDRCSSVLSTQRKGSQGDMRWHGDVSRRDLEAEALEAPVPLATVDLWEVRCCCCLFPTGWNFWKLDPLEAQGGGTTISTPRTGRICDKLAG